MDTILIAYLKRLREVQANYPSEALLRPAEKNAFGYGEACGVMKGLAMADQLLQVVLKGDEKI